MERQPALVQRLEVVNQELRARHRQQSAVAALGQTAIRMRDLQTFLQYAAQVVSETLGVESSAVLEQVAARSVLLRAGVGWHEGQVGAHTIPAGADTVLGLVLGSDAPVVVADPAHESRFTPPTLFPHGIVSAAYAVIRGRARPWGVLGALTTHARSFRADDFDFLQSVANVLALALERHEVEVAQRREKETLQAIYDNIPVMISVYGPSGGLLQANRAWQETLGWSLREAQTTDDFLAQVYPDPMQRDEVLEFLRRAEGQWVDFRPRTRDGRTIDVSWVRMELSDGSRIGFGVDITERKRAETALAESQARFSKIFQACPVALGMWTSPDARILDVNPAWLDLFGYKRAEVVGRTTAELDLADHETRTTSMDRIREDGEIRDLEVRVRRKSGERLDLIVSSVPVDIPGHEPSFVTAHLDVTERDRLLRSESAARAEAETALEQLRAMQAITDRALVHLGLDEQLRELLTRLRQALSADRAALSLVDEKEQVLYTRAVNGMPFDVVAGVRVPLGQGVTGRIAAEGRPLVFHDLTEVDVSGVKNMPPPGVLRPARSVAGAPLHVGDKVIGVVTVASELPNRFTEDQLHLLLLVADRVAPVIEQSRLVERVRAGEERLKTLSRRLMMAQEEERRRLAVELHDELGQVLTAVKINLESMEASALPGDLMARLKATTECVDQAMQRVRDLALDLRPSVLDDLGLPAALRWYADRFARDRPLKVHVAIEAVPDLRPEVEIACFRVAQEALTNVARHARAQHVWLDLHLIAEGLELRVRDDGIGFDGPAARARATGGASMGLLGMEERVSLVGGELALVTGPGNGTEVRARFPVAERGRGTA